MRKCVAGTSGWSALAVAALAVTAFGIGASPAAAATLTVDKDRAQCPRAQFATIQAAIDNARPGDTLKLCPDLYSEQVTISKPLTVRADDRGSEDDCQTADAADSARQVIVAPAGTGFTVAFRLASDDVTLRGLVIEGASVGVDASDAFSGYRVTDNRIENSSLFAIDAGSSGA